MILRSFFFNDTATTEIYTLSLHDALPISTDIRRLLDGLFYVVRTGCQWRHLPPPPAFPPWPTVYGYFRAFLDRKSTRLNSSHANISYAVFCLKKKYSLLLKNKIL